MSYGWIAFVFIVWSCGYVMFMAYHKSTFTAVYFKHKDSNPPIANQVYKQLHTDSPLILNMFMFLVWWAFAIRWMISPPFMIDIGDREDE